MCAVTVQRGISVEVQLERFSPILLFLCQVYIFNTAELTCIMLLDKIREMRQPCLSVLEYKLC